MTTTKQYDRLNRLASIASAPGGAGQPPVTFSYWYNEASQRVRTTLTDGSYWLYEYDRLGQVRSGRKYWSDGTPVAGQQFEYGHDDIGNRTQTRAGGDENGANLRTAGYSANSLNQYTSRAVPGAVDIMGVAHATASVTVNSATAYRRGEYFRKEVAVANGSVPAWPSISVVTSGGGSDSGNVFVPRTPESFGYDADGNLTSDGRWNYTWDAENRLVRMVANTSAGPQQRIDFEYDWKGRRIGKKVWGNTAGSGDPDVTLKFVYDDWNLVAILDSQSSILQSFLWGLDLSGTLQGAGGVGGLLAVNDTAQGAHFCAYDGNGNVAALVKATDGTVSATYEYGPFGEVIRATGPMARANPFRFSSKHQDDDTDFLYYGYRYYNSISGRWLSRDPIGEDVGMDLYGMVHNDPVDLVDAFGLWETDVHHDIVDGWLADNPYASFPWHCCKVPVKALLKDGSDAVDGAGGHFLNFLSAQASRNAYQHAMRSPRQTIAEAQALYNKFLDDHINRARNAGNQARGRRCWGSDSWCCVFLQAAVREVGKAYHAYSDSLSPSHSGVQTWWGPIDGVREFGTVGYYAYVRAHAEGESMEVYQGMKGSVVSSVKGRFQGVLDEILKE